jgi:hypothetical protein
MYSNASTPRMDSVNLQEESLTIDLNDRLSVRAYFDCRPHCMETAPLQKGLVLMLDDKELIEEGIGFGVPVVKYEDKTYFSALAKLSMQKSRSSRILRKTYLLDAVSRKKVGQESYINDDFYSLVHKTFEKLYLHNKRISPFLNKIMELRDLARIRTEFEKVDPRGIVIVNYEVTSSIIKISVDFSNLTLNNCQEVLVLNEQGSTIFEKYADTSGIKLVGKNIGAWDTVTANQASLLNGNEQLAFSLQRVKGATLFRGWEKTRNRFSWAGLSYSLCPNHGTFEYAIHLDMRKQAINAP